MSRLEPKVPKSIAIKSGNDAVLRRCNQMRGLHLAATGVEYTWTDLGRPLGWSASTCSDVSSGRRVLRVADIASLAYLLDASPGWLAFEEGVARPGQHEPIPGIPMDYGTEVTAESLEEEAAKVRRVAKGKRRA